MAKVAGYIKEINVDVGDHVQHGQLLATLEIPEMADDLKKADAAVVRAKAEVTRANDELRRSESAHNIAHLSYQRLAAVAEKKPGLVAQQEIDEAQSRDLVTEAQVASGMAIRHWFTFNTARGAASYLPVQFLRAAARNKDSRLVPVLRAQSGKTSIRTLILAQFFFDQPRRRRFLLGAVCHLTR
jgi:multidrug resistance efflux pump